MTKSTIEIMARGMYDAHPKYTSEEVYLKGMPTNPWIRPGKAQRLFKG